MEWARCPRHRTDGLHLAWTRDVFVNGRRWGQTNHLLVIGPGTWNVSLGQHVDYKPPQQPVTVVETTAESPKEIAFVPVPGVV